MTPLQVEYRRRCRGDHDARAQLGILYAWARHPGARIIELGVREGNSTSAFLAGTEHSGGTLWSVDIAPPAVPAWWLGVPQWHLLVADDLSPDALGWCPQQADVLFIDTSHLYEPTLGELRAYGPRVRPGGVILVHDTDTPGTADAWPDVPQVLDDWCAEAGLEWYSHPDRNGLGVIEIPDA